MRCDHCGTSARRKLDQAGAETVAPAGAFDVCDRHKLLTKLWPFKVLCRGGMPLACCHFTSIRSPCTGLNDRVHSIVSSSQAIRSRARTVTVTARLEDQDLTVSRRLVCTAPLVTLGALALGLPRPQPSEAVGIPEVLSQGLKKQLGQSINLHVP